MGMYNMFSLQIIALSSVLISVVFTATVAPVTKLSGCVYHGKTYAHGQSFQPTPCEHCFCGTDGRAMCAIADCFITPCVDAIHDPTKCCPVCPNGPNCRHQDGTIIKKGDVYRPDANTVCSCPDHSFMMSAPVAICAVSMTVAPPHVIVD